MTLLLLDLDNLKPINDSFGHQAGNRALCGVAAVLRGAIRPYDVCVRYGGDEFIVLLSDCGVDQAEAKRLELQEAVEAIPFSVGELLTRDGCRSAPARPSSPSTATPTTRCSRWRTAGCTTTRPRASGSRSARPVHERPAASPEPPAQIPITW